MFVESPSGPPRDAYNVAMLATIPEGGKIPQIKYRLDTEIKGHKLFMNLKAPLW